MPEIPEGYSVLGTVEIPEPPVNLPKGYTMLGTVEVPEPDLKLPKGYTALGSVDIPVRKQTGATREPLPSFVGDVVMPTINDLSGVITKAGAGLIQGSTFGVVDPERGKIGIPFTDVKFKYAPPLAESLESFGMTPELAENPYIGIGPQMIGLGKGWGEISSFLSKAIMARRAGQTAKSLITGAEALPKPLSAIERIGLQTGIGGAVGAAWPREKDESIIENTLSTAALGGGLQALAEGIAVIAKTTGLGKANAYQNLKQELSDIFYERAFSEKLGRTLSRAEADFAAGQAIDKGLASAGIEKPTWKDLWSAWRKVKGRRGMPPPTGEPTAGPVPPGPTEGPIPPGPVEGAPKPSAPEPQAPMPPSGIGSLEQILAQGAGKPPVPPVRPIPGLKPSAPVIPEPDYAAEAAQAGVVFNGLQETGEGKRPLPLFTDPVTKSTFILPEGETIPDALAKVRKKFQKKVEIPQGTPPISAAIIPPAGEPSPETGVLPSREEIVQPGATPVDKQPWEMTHEDLKAKYPSLPQEIVDRLGKITVDPRHAGEGNFVPGEGLNIKGNDQILLHEVGHVIDNILTPEQASQWEGISKVELKNGILGNKPDKLAADPYSVWENLYSAFSIYHRNLAGEKLLPSEVASLEKYPEVYQFVKDNLSEGTPSVLKDYPELAKGGVYRARGLEDAIKLRQQEPEGSLTNYDEQNQKEWLRGQAPPKDGKITLYRATPTGQEIKPGDYVTNSLQYAKDHIEANLGKGKITKIEATLDDIYPADGPGEFWYAPKSIETTPKAVGGTIPVEYISKLKTNIKGTKEYKNFVPEPPEDIKGLTEVSDKDGIPKVVYHGTTENIKDFSGEFSSMANPSVDLANIYGTHFTSSKDDALFYAKGGFYGKPTKHSKVIEAYLDIRNPYTVKKTEQILSQFQSHSQAKNWMIEHGYDGLHIVPEEGKIEWWVPFERDQIILAKREKITPDQHDAIIALDGANGNIDEAFRVLRGWKASQKSFDFINKIAKEILPALSRPPKGGGQAVPAAKPIPARTPRPKIPPTSEQIAKKKALMSIPVNQAVDFIVKNGYLNIENVKALSKQDALRLNRRFFNRAPFGKMGSIARKDGKLGLDEVAAEFPQYFGTEQKNPDEHLLDILLDRGIAKSIEGKTDAELGAAEYEHYINKHGITGEDALDARSGEDQERIEGISLDEIAGEAGLTEEERRLAAADAGEFFDAVAKPKEETSIPKGTFETGDLAGMSAAETFDLVNPETEIGTLQPQDRGPKTEGMFETPSGTADAGGYAERTRTEPPKPKTEAERNAYIANPRLYLELPEIVEFANRALEGKFPQVRRFMGMALGRFYPGSGKIKIINNMDLDTLAKVLAHEIGHLADWLPDKDMAKGNILGRIGSIPSYLKSLLEEYPGAPGKVLTEKDRERLRREAERQIKGDMSDEDIVTYITRTVPKYEEVGITPDMILNLLKGLTNEPKNVLDFLKSIDGKIKAEIAKQAMKNLVDERLKLMMGRRIIGTETITEEVRRKRETKPERVAARYRELLREEIEKRRLYQREAISNELKDLTQKWKPFTPGEDSYTKYRLSSKELYADAVSVLFNDPELLRQTAPTFWKAFFNYFERKSELKAIYDELQARRANPDEVLEQRRRFTRGMAEEGAQIRARNAELLKSRNTLTPSKLWHAFRMAFGDQNIRAQEFMEAARKAGKAVADKDRIDYWVEELPYINSEVFGFRTGIEKDILAPAAESGIGLIDLHEYMILKRAATERAGIYNPGGIGDRFADQQLDFMRKKLGDEKFGTVKELVERFQAEYRRQVTEVVAEADFLPADLVKTMMENPNYATFANLEYLIEQHMGKGTSARIYRQYGMLGKVDNVFVQTVLKGMALIRAARHHQTKMALIQSPDVGTVARARRGHKGVGWQKPKDPDMGTIVVSPGGQMQAYYIDKELAQLWEHNEDKANAVTAVGMQGLRLIKGILGRIFIAWNPGWIVANPPRDFWATWKKVQEASGSLAKGIVATFADAVQAGTGKFPERERRMLAERKILPARFFNEPGSFDAMEREFLADINDPIIYNNKVLAPFLKAAHWLSENKNWFIIPRITKGLEVLGKIGERWGKFAADEAIRLQAEKKGLPIPEKRAAHLVRTRAGTPNSLSQGTLYWLTEMFFPFSNIAAQDLRSSLEAFRENKGSYAFKTFLLNVLPKLIYAAMIAGYFGDDIKKTASKIGKYFRRMYINFPIAVLKDGNVVNITIPQDYTGQTVSALTDSVLSGDWSGSMGTLGILFENQPYNFNPFISSASDWVNYYALNQRPNDSFTGYPTMPQDVADVGGKRALAHMTRQTWNRFFGTMLYRVQADKVDQVENELKTWLGAAPFNAIGRFIRITNTGDVERDMQTVSDVAREEKEARLNLREAKIRDINARAGQATAKDIMTLYRQAVEAGDIDPIATSPSAFAKSYKETALSREKNTFVQAMTRAATDREKAALLLRWKAEMPDKEYEDLRKYLRENGLIGPGAGVQMLLESQREKYPGRKSVPELLKKARGQ